MISGESKMEKCRCSNHIVSIYPFIIMAWPLEAFADEATGSGDVYAFGLKGGGQLGLGYTTESWPRQKLKACPISDSLKPAMLIPWCCWETAMPIRLDEILMDN